MATTTMPLGDASTATTATLAFTGSPDAQNSTFHPASPTSYYTGAAPMSSPTSLSPKPDATLGASNGFSESVQSVGDVNALLDSEPDPQILEALRSKDRIYVLKLGEQMEALIKERRQKIDLSPSTSYQRLLVHRCSAYYRLSPETDANTKNIVVYYRIESRVPQRRISELVPMEESAQPTVQIMRRGDRLRGRQTSQPSSSTGDDADTSDVETSEAGSVGGRSNATGSSARRYMTIEEREAAYNEARSRIFMDFEEKEKEKEKDMSANSSTFSLVSGSGSTSGGRGSSIGDLDDSASSAPTESEWSGPVTRDKREPVRGGSGGSSSRSLRSTGQTFNANGSGNSSRNSRAASPSFSYPSLYEPASTASYEPSQYGQQPPPPPGYIAQYMYPTYNTGPQGQPYMNAYPYYPPYGYPPQPQQHSDPGTPSNGDSLYPHPVPQHQMAYSSPYGWGHTPPPGQPAGPPHHVQHGHPSVASAPDMSHPAHLSTPPVHGIPQYPSYPPPSVPYNPYAPQGYYPQSYQPNPLGTPAHQMQSPMYHPGEIAREQPLENGMHDGYARGPPRQNSNGHHGGINGGGKRGMARTRGAWSYGPGTSVNNYGYPGQQNGYGGNDAYGPRLHSGMRRTSGASSASGSNGARTPADETSSISSSSTTSSSSRRTFTSTSTTSKHPLPPRPDWAVGLKPQNPRHHEHHSGPNSRTMSPRVGGAHLGPHQPLPASQPNANDFPPLSSAPERRQPVVGGAWTNTSTSRIMMSSTPASGPQQSTALVHYPAGSQQGQGQNTEGPNGTFERPPPKGNAELFNPKAGSPRGSISNGRAKGAGLVEKMGSMNLGDGERGAEAPSDAPLHGEAQQRGTGEAAPSP